MNLILKIAAVSLMALSSSLVFASWEDWTVWQKNKSRHHSIEGKVKTIALDEVSDRLIVKIKKTNGSIEVVHICHEGIQSARQQAFGDPKLSLLKTAMAHGQNVQLNYESNFDRCIQSLSILSEKNPSGIQKASHQPSGNIEI